MSMPASLGTTRDGWEESVSLEPQDVIDERARRIADAFRPDDEENDHENLENPGRTGRYEEDPEERRLRNQENSRRGQERRQQRESLALTGQGFDRDGNVVIANPAVYRGWLEAQGVIPPPGRQAAPTQEPEQRRETRQERAAPPPLPELDDPNDPMPEDMFDAEKMRAWTLRQSQRAVQRATEEMRREVAAREEQRQAETEARYQEIAAPLQQGAGHQALLAAQRVLPQAGMGALLDEPDFAERMVEVLQGGKVALDKWTDPDTLTTLAGVMIAKNPDLLRKVALSHAPADRETQEQERGRNLENQDRRGPAPRNPETYANQAQEAQRNSYSQFGTSRGTQRSAESESSRQIPEAVREFARSTGMAVERAMALYSDNTGAAVAEYDRRVAAQRRREGR